MPLKNRTRDRTDTIRKHNTILKRMKRVDESENQRQIRLAIAKGTTAAARETETANQRQSRLIQHRFTTAKARASESVEQKQARLKRRRTAAVAFKNIRLEDITRIAFSHPGATIHNNDPSLPATVGFAY